MLQKAEVKPELNRKLESPSSEKPQLSSLKISNKNDKQEQEADAVADRVMLMPSNKQQDIAMSGSPKAALHLSANHEQDTLTLQENDNEKDDSLQLMPDLYLQEMAGNPDNSEDESTIATKVDSKKSENSLQLKEEDTLDMQTEDEDSSKISLKSANSTELIDRTAEDDDNLQLKEDEEKLNLQESEDKESELNMQGNELTSSETVSDDEDSGLQLKRIQTKDGTNYAPSDVQNTINRTKGQGNSLPEKTQSELGSKMGTDFRNVKVHNDAEASGMNSQLGAKAFTHGNDIYFKSGEYNPGSSQGKRLLAHELTHTVQQNGQIQKQEALPTEEEKKDNKGDPKKEVNKEEEKEKLNKEINESGTQLIDQQKLDKEIPLKESKDEKKVKPEEPKAEETKTGENAVLIDQPLPDVSDKKDLEVATSIEEKLEGKEQQEPIAVADEEGGELPSLDSIMEPVKAESGSPAESVGGVSEDVEGSPIGEEKEEEQYSELPGEYIEKIDNAFKTVRGKISWNSKDAQSKLEAKGAGIRDTLLARIDKQLGSAVNDIRSQRDKVGKWSVETDAYIDKQERLKLVEADKVGSIEKQDIRKIFLDHLKNIDGKITENKKAKDNLYTKYSDKLNKGIDKDIGEVKAKATAKSSSFSRDARGWKQEVAVWKVARGTIKEMKKNKPKVLKGLVKILKPIPEKFDEGGVKAKFGIIQHVPKLIEEVDKQIKATKKTIKGFAEKTRGKLKTIRDKLFDQLDKMEKKTIAGLEAKKPKIYNEVNSALEKGKEAINKGKWRAISKIKKVVDDAKGKLENVEQVDEDAIIEFGDAIIGFVNGAGEDSGKTLQQAGYAMGKKFDQLKESANLGLNIMDGSFKKAMKLFDSKSKDSFKEFKKSFDTGISEIFKSLSEGLKEFKKKIKEKLTESLKEMQTGFDKTLGKAEVKIQEAVNEGLAKNKESLSTVDSKMSEAAKEAGWEYDHPVLAALEGFFSFIAGLIIGILMVLVVVVLVIVAFKLLIVGLVALGVSLVVAKVIAVVAGLALLGYGIYKAYQARIAAGEEGGWGTFGLALLDMTGITAIYEGATAEGLSPWERGLKIGQGVATLGTFFIGRKLNTKISNHMPKFIQNPQKGSFWNLFGKKQPTAPPTKTTPSTPKIPKTEPKAAKPKPTKPEPKAPKAEKPKPTKPEPKAPKAEKPKPVKAEPKTPKLEKPKPAKPEPKVPKVEKPKPAKSEPKAPKAEKPKPAKSKPKQKKESPPGLEKRGYKPKPGERSMTKAEWKKYYRNQRINARRTREINKFLKSGTHRNNRATAWKKYKGNLSKKAWEKRYDNNVRKRLTRKLVKSATRPTKPVKPVKPKLTGKTKPDPNWKSTQTGITDKNSKILRDNLGIKKGSGDDAHHIVQSTHKRAQAARDILDKYQIDINDKANGIPLKGGKGAPKFTSPRHHHGSELHTHKGIDAVSARIIDAQRGIANWGTARKAILAELRILATEILNGTFPP